MMVTNLLIYPIIFDKFVAITASISNGKIDSKPILLKAVLPVSKGKYIDINV